MSLSVVVDNFAALTEPRTRSLGCVRPQPHSRARLLRFSGSDVDANCTRSVFFGFQFAEPGLSNPYPNEQIFFGAYTKPIASGLRGNICVSD